VQHVVPNARKDRLVADLLELPEESSIASRWRGSRCPGCMLAHGIHQGRMAVIITAHSALPAWPAGQAQPPLAMSAGRAGGPGRGYAEIVLTGVHLGSWGQDLGTELHLRHLVEALLHHSESADCACLPWNPGT
jgi:hypothetical protein